MSRRAQGEINGPGRVSAARRLTTVVAVLCAATVSACAGGFDLRQVETDTSLVTSSVSGGGAAAGDPEKLSDETTIRNAVTSVDAAEMKLAEIPWSNPGTGSRGAISAITEYRDQGTLCRRFTASRENYQGVGLYRGDVCLHAAGFWLMKRFESS